MEVREDVDVALLPQRASASVAELDPVQEIAFEGTLPPHFEEELEEKLALEEKKQCSCEAEGTRRIMAEDSEDDLPEDPELGPLWNSTFRHSKQFFILSWAGRPVFTRHGDETELAVFLGVVQALISSCESQGLKVRSLVAGERQIVILVRGPLYMVAVSKLGRESVLQLTKQLNYLYLVIVCILTEGVMKVLQNRPTYDLRNLMGGTEVLIHAMMNDFKRSPDYFLDCIRSVPLSQDHRFLIGSIIRNKILEELNLKTTSPKSSAPKNPVLFAVLLADGKLVQLVRPKDRALHAVDLILLSNFVSNLPSLKASESWTPICLPKFNASV